MMNDIIAKAFDNVRQSSPLIHNITNYVTVNDCANILLACGASPIMADDENEVFEITSICAGLNINIGTLNSRTVSAMKIAGKRAKELGHPIVLDPVGVGASRLRTETAMSLLSEVKPTVIRGNISEIKTMMAGSGTVKGVDAGASDRVTEQNIDEIIKTIKAFSKETDAIVAVTGETDIVADESRALVIHNGCAEMSAVTGTGCQLSALTAAFVTANPENRLEAAAAAVMAMGLAGEIAKSRMSEKDGSGTFRAYLTDAIYNMTGNTLAKGAKYEVR